MEYTRRDPHTYIAAQRVTQNSRLQALPMVSCPTRHLTADRRRRHALEADGHCYLCDQDPETIDHIIALCSYFREVWWHMLEI